MSRHSRKWLLTALLLASPTSFALQQVSMPDNGSAVARISLKEVNRIAVQDGRIRQVFGAEGQLHIEIDTEKGEVYVRPLEARTVVSDGMRRAVPINLFLTDNQNRTYTLVLESHDIPAETILLASTSRARISTHEKGMPYVEALTEAIRAMANNEIPDGFEMRQVNQQVPLWGETNFILQSTFHGDQWVGERYLLTNVSKGEMRLLESEFSRSGVLAVSVERAVLRTNEQTLVLVIREASGK